jgi:hypothetical protein
VTLSDQSPRSGSFQIAIITVIGVPTPTAADIAPRLCPRLANQCDRSEAAHEVRYGCNRPDGCCQSHTGSNDAHKQKRLHWEAPHVIDQMSSRNITSMHVAPQDTESSLRGTSSLFDAYRKEVMPGRQLVPPAPQRIARLWIAPQQSATLCSSASQLLWRSPTSRARASSANDSSPSRCGPSLSLDTDGQSGDIPASDAILLRVMCSWTPAGRQFLA